MAFYPLAWINQEQLATDVERAKEKLRPEVVEVSYRLDTDSTGEPSIFFRVVLADWAATWERIGDVTRKVRDTLFEETQPVDRLGLNPYVNFNSETEWRKSKERKAG